MCMLSKRGYIIRFKTVDEDQSNTNLNNRKYLAYEDLTSCTRIYYGLKLKKQADERFYEDLSF